LNQSSLLAQNADFQADVLDSQSISFLQRKWSAKETVLKEAARTVRFLKDQGYLEKPAGRSGTPAQQRKAELIAAQAMPPVETAPTDERVRELERQVGLLKSQILWSEHANAPTRQGGTFTINHSDDHYGDRAHMLDCHAEMVEKTFQLLHLYCPEKIVWFSNGDKIAGRGVYKEQHMDSVVPDTRQQRNIGVTKEVRIYERIKSEFPDAEIICRYTHGNHDVNMGERITPDFVYALRAFGLPAIYHGDEAILNLSDNGQHLAYFEHGTGYSDISPSSPKWWRNMLDKLHTLSRKHYGDQRIRRVGHGHTHWASLGLERNLDLYVDTTGGCQRNERVLLGKNNRPMGWIAYISPKGYDNILDPILIQPELVTVERELHDPYLFNRNLEDASECLRAYREMALSAGILADNQYVPEGR
jgi:hypothetical protein